MNAPPSSLLVKIGEHVSIYKKQSVYGWLKSGMGHIREYGLTVFNAYVTGGRNERSRRTYTELISHCLIPCFRRDFSVKKQVTSLRNRLSKTNKFGLLVN